MDSPERTPIDRAGRVACPFCDSTDNELFSVFGQTLIGSQYYCHNCHTVFEAVRWEGEGRQGDEREGDEREGDEGGSDETEGDDVE